MGECPFEDLEPLLAEQPSRRVQHDHALSGVGLVPGAGDEDLRERVSDGEQRRELPLKHAGVRQGELLHQIAREDRLADVADVAV